MFQPSVAVATDHGAATQVAKRPNGFAGGQSAEQVGGARNGDCLPAARVMVDGLEPKTCGQVVDLDHSVSAGDREPGWESFCEVGLVDGRFVSPRETGSRYRPLRLGDVLELG